MFFADPFKRNKLSRDKNVPRITCLMITLPVEKKDRVLPFRGTGVGECNEDKYNIVKPPFCNHFNALGTNLWLS